MIQTCSKCQEEKDVSSFNVDRSGRDGLRASCITCVSKRLDPDYDLMNMYGLTRKSYEVMCKTQDQRCKICNVRVKLYIDHDHRTDVIRGLLCNNCNLGLGHFKEQLNILKKAMAYLEKAPKKPNWKRLLMKL